MEDPDFERHFEVYGEDDHETRYVLSTSLMRRIVELEEKLDLDTRISTRQAHRRSPLGSPNRLHGARCCYAARPRDPPRPDRNHEQALRPRWAAHAPEHEDAPSP